MSYFLAKLNFKTILFANYLKFMYIISYLLQKSIANVKILHKNLHFSQEMEIFCLIALIYPEQFGFFAYIFCCK